MMCERGLVMTCYKNFFVLLAILFSFILSSCGPTLETEMKKIFKEKYKMTEEEAETGAAHGVRMNKAKRDLDGKLVIEEDKDGNKYYPIDFSSVPVDEKIKELESILEMLSGLNDERKLDPRDRQFLEYFPQVLERLKKQKKSVEWQLKRYTRVKRFEEFLVWLGLPSEKIKENKKLRDGAYVACPLVDIEKDTVFEPEYVILAKKDGRHKITEKLVVNWDFWVKEDNKDYPEKNPTKKKIWVNKTIKLLFLSIDVDDLPDKKADYITVFRLGEDDLREKHPVISVFHSVDSKYLGVAVIDEDSSEDPFFGIPNRFMSLGGIEKGSDLISKYRGIIDSILNPEQRSDKEFKFTKKKMEVYLMQPGKVDISSNVDVSKDGWKVPVKYRVIGKKGKVKNFTVHIKYKKKKLDDKSLPNKIEWVAFKYHSPSSEYSDIEGRVVEFYGVSEKFSDLMIEKINILDKEITLFPENGSAIQMLIHALISAKPYRIDYDSGEQRAVIVDTNGDGVYTERRSQKKPLTIELKQDVSSKKKSAYSGYGM